MIPTSKLKKIVLNSLVKLLLDSNEATKDGIWKCCCEEIYALTESSPTIPEIKDLFFKSILPDLSINNFGYEAEVVEKLVNLGNELANECDSREADLPAASSLNWEHRGNNDNSFAADHDYCQDQSYIEEILNLEYGNRLETASQNESLGEEIENILRKYPIMNINSQESTAEDSQPSEEMCTFTNSQFDTFSPVPEEDPLNGSITEDVNDSETTENTVIDEYDLLLNSDIVIQSSQLNDSAGSRSSFKRKSPDDSIDSTNDEIEFAPCKIKRMSQEPEETPNFSLSSNTKSCISQIYSLETDNESGIKHTTLMYICMDSNQSNLFNSLPEDQCIEVVSTSSVSISGPKDSDKNQELENLIEEPQAVLPEPQIHVTEPQVVVSDSQVCVPERQADISNPQVDVCESQVDASESQLHVASLETHETEPQVNLIESQTTPDVHNQPDSSKCSSGNEKTMYLNDVPMQSQNVEEFSDEIENEMQKIHQNQPEPLEIIDSNELKNSPRNVLIPKEARKLRCKFVYTRLSDTTINEDSSNSSQMPTSQNVILESSDKTDAVLSDNIQDIEDTEVVISLSSSDNEDDGSKTEIISTDVKVQNIRDASKTESISSTKSETAKNWCEDLKCADDDVVAPVNQKLSKNCSKNLGIDTKAASVQPKSIAKEVPQIENLRVSNVDVPESNTRAVPESVTKNAENLANVPTGSHPVTQTKNWWEDLQIADDDDVVAPVNQKASKNDSKNLSTATKAAKEVPQNNNLGSTNVDVPESNTRAVPESVTKNAENLTNASTGSHPITQAKNWWEDLQIADDDVVVMKPVIQKASKNDPKKFGIPTKTASVQLKSIAKEMPQNKNLRPTNVDVPKSKSQAVPENATKNNENLAIASTGSNLMTQTKNWWDDLKIADDDEEPKSLKANSKTQKIPSVSSKNFTVPQKVTMTLPKAPQSSVPEQTKVVPQKNLYDDLEIVDINDEPPKAPVITAVTDKKAPERSSENRVNSPKKAEILEKSPKTSESRVKSPKKAEIRAKSPKKDESRVEGPKKAVVKTKIWLQDSASESSSDESFMQTSSQSEQPQEVGKSSIQELPKSVNSKKIEELQAKLDKYAKNYNDQIKKIMDENQEYLPHLKIYILGYDNLEIAEDEL